MPYDLIFTESYEKTERRFLKRHPDLRQRYYFAASRRDPAATAAILTFISTRVQLPCGATQRHERGQTMNFQRPSNIPEHADLCLKAIFQAGLSDRISLGGAFGLLHYLDYRSTYDVDAWWAPSATDREQHLVIAAVKQVLAPLGEVRTRAWGDVVSIELLEGKRKVFSFQIAHRTAQLQPSTPLPWANSLLDSFDDLVASKMVAMVERGAPRDFRDIHAVCHAGLMNPEQCWELWRQRQTLADSDADRVRATLALQIHLERIALHRPLAQIEDPTERAEAEQLRRWFVEEFIHVSLD